MSIEIAESPGGSAAAVGLTNQATALAADAERSGVAEGTSDHQGFAANTIVISNLNNDGDIMLLGSDGGNSLEFLLANMDVADLIIGHGMATMILKTASGNMTLSPGGSLVVSTNMFVANNRSLSMGSDSDAKLHLNTAGLAADEELAAVIEGTSNHQGTAANSLIISNVTDNGDIIMLVSDGGNSLEFLLADADIAKLTLGWGMATTDIVASAGIKMVGRMLNAQGADVASADEITLGIDGNYIDITGTTTINHIANTSWLAGAIVMLQFDASVTVTHNAASPTGTEASILLAGAVDFSATAGDTLVLVYDGTTFRELSRTAI